MKNNKNFLTYAVALAFLTLATPLVQAFNFNVIDFRQSEGRGQVGFGDVEVIVNGFIKNPSFRNEVAQLNNNLVGDIRAVVAENYGVSPEFVTIYYRAINAPSFIELSPTYDYQSIEDGIYNVFIQKDLSDPFFMN